MEPLLAHVLVAIVVAAGTLLGLSWFQQGATRARSLLPGCDVDSGTIGPDRWLVPMAEPYRTSRIIGERLASLSAELALEPVLLEYQEPGVVYALGRSIATSRIVTASSRISRVVGLC